MIADSGWWFQLFFPQQIGENDPEWLVLFGGLTPPASHDKTQGHYVTLTMYICNYMHISIDWFMVASQDLRTNLSNSTSEGEVSEMFAAQAAPFSEALLQFASGDSQLKLLWPSWTTQMQHGGYCTCGQPNAINKLPFGNGLYTLYILYHPWKWGLWGWFTIGFTTLEFLVIAKP